MNSNLELIVVSCIGLIVITVALYGKLHRFRVRQQQSFAALQLPCPVCQALTGSPCVNGEARFAYL
jgi:hypothetical protein